MSKFVTFHSRAAGDFMLFGEVARNLLQGMGHSGTVPGALLPEDIEPALQRLRASLASAPAVAAGQSDDEPEVPLSRRAYPLVKMLEASLAAQCEVMWE
ncbi:MAG: DUF1840 domain-containing protein [Gammaproteobacteria bacterium]|nr:DUF1840 domain-containing protein [Gammaproteobacteria bacterium]